MGGPIEHGALNSAKRLMAELIEQAFEASRGRPARRHQTVRVTLPIADVDVLHWLGAQEADAIVYWAGRDGELEVAGLGAADVVAEDGPRDFHRPLEKIRERLDPGEPGLRYYGGFSFSPSDEITAAWEPFGSCRFVLPRIEILNRSGQSYLACNLVFREGEPHRREVDNALVTLYDIRFPKTRKVDMLEAPVSREDRPDRSHWCEMVERALGLIRGNAFTKIVLARETDLSFARKIAPLSLLATLAHRGDNGYRFYFQPRRFAAFLGASPERLYKRRSRYIQTEAVAGTRPRGNSPAEDTALWEELLASEKDRSEHHIVAAAIRDVLHRLCRTVHIAPELSDLRLKHCRHLLCSIEGLLASTDADAVILEAMHPTPSVGGYPAARALENVARLEPFKRGWYAGPVGWAGYDAAEFAVAIRSGLVRENTLTLYTGAGIIDGSIPQAEWEELESKLGLFVGIWNE